MSDLKSRFPHIFVINLPRSIERRNYIKHILSEKGLAFTFVEAVDGESLNKKEVKEVYNRNKAKVMFGRELLIGEIGCALSHIKVYQKILDENINHAIILEDDAIIKSNFVNSIELVLDSNFKWDLILLGHNKSFDSSNEISSIISNWGIKRLDKITNIGRIVRGGLGCYGYLISQSGAKKILNYIEENSIVYPIDKITSNYAIVNFYGLFPTVVSVDFDFESSIDNNGNRNNDRDGELVYEIAKLLKKTPFFNIARTLWFTALKIKPIKKYK